MQKCELNNIEEGPTFLISLKAHLAANECSAVTNANYAAPIAPAAQAGQLAKELYIIAFKKHEREIEKSFGLIISSLHKMPTMRDNILKHQSVIDGGANGNLVYIRLLAEFAAGPSEEALAERVENEILLIRVAKGEDARVAIDALERLYSRLSGTFSPSNFKKIQRLIQLLPNETLFIDTLKATGINYSQICSEINKKQHAARSREEATAIANTVQLESILKNKDEKKNEDEGVVNFAELNKANYSRKSDRREQSGDEGNGYDSASGQRFKRQSRHLELHKKSLNRNVEHYSTNSERNSTGFPAASLHQQSSNNRSGNNNFPNNNYYGSSGNNSNNSNFRSDNRRPRDLSSTQCYSCRQFGHISTYCPKNK